MPAFALLCSVLVLRAEGGRKEGREGVDGWMQVSGTPPVYLHGDNVDRYLIWLGMFFLSFQSWMGYVVRVSRGCV